MSELTEYSASALARAIRTKEVSSQEVVAAHLQRIEAVNPHLNAVVQLSKTAMDEACAADAAPTAPSARAATAMDLAEKRRFMEGSC